MEELIIKNGLLVTPQGTIKGGLAVKNEKIIQIGTDAFSAAKPAGWTCVTSHVLQRSCLLVPTRLDASSLSRPTPVMGNRRYVFDGEDIESGGLEGGDGALSAGPGPFDADLDFVEAHLLCSLGDRPRRLLGGERGALARALLPGRPPGLHAEHVSAGVRDGNQRVVKRGLHVRDPARDASLYSLAL